MGSATIQLRTLPQIVGKNAPLEGIDAFRTNSAEISLRFGLDSATVRLSTLPEMVGKSSLDKA